MLQKIIYYLITFALLFYLGNKYHSYFIDNLDVILPFSLIKIYGFHALYSLIVCILFLYYSKKEKIAEQLGFIYLWALLFKIILFCIMFYKLLFSLKVFSKTESISLLIPMALFLIVEVIFIAKILNTNHNKIIN